MAIPKKKKPTLKEVLGNMGNLLMQIEQLRMHVFNGDRALDEYMKMKGDKDEFQKYLAEKYKPEEDDKDNEETKEK
jgi:hypothetical protein|tara:strand:- start:979 stop:1206 length:228 start_codon:yes stop_codon:yes gene_type:complete